MCVNKKFFKNLSFCPTLHNEGPGGNETSGMNEKKFTPTDDLREEEDGPSCRYLATGNHQWTYKL